MSIEHTYIESIGQRNLQAPLRVYFAGKVRKGNEDWRSLIFNNDRIMSHDICDGEMNVYRGDKWNAGTVFYGGPSALSCDHGCWHRTDHGIVNEWNNDQDFTFDGGSVHVGREWPSWFVEPASCPTGDNGLSQKQAVERCMYQIHLAEAVYAFIDSPDCHGTLAEIGFAYALGIPIHLVFHDGLKNSRTVIDHDNHGVEMEHDDFWFIKQMATTVDYGFPWAGVGHIAYNPAAIAPRSQGILRERIKPSDRVKVLVRDNYQCRMCGISRVDGAVLELDHIHPVSKGGSNDLTNLQVLCRECNSGKSNKIIPMPWQQGEQAPLRWDV
jgi:hypothetical protein